MTEEGSRVPLYSWFAPKQDATTGAVLVGEAAALIGYESDAPWGRDSEGRPLTLDQFVTQYCDIVEIGGQSQAVPRPAPNNGAVAGTRVRYSEVNAFIRDFGNLGISIVGPLSGEVAGLGGGSFTARSLPPRAANAVELYVAVMTPDSTLPAGWTIEVAQTAPFYGGTGGAYQLVFFDEFGAPVRFTDPRLAASGVITFERYEEQQA